MTDIAIREPHQWFNVSLHHYSDSAFFSSFKIERAIAIWLGIVIRSFTRLFHVVKAIKNGREKKREKQRNDNPIRVAVG
jgi:hypothetical protein